CRINKALVVMRNTAEEGVNADVGFERFAKFTSGSIDPVIPFLFGYRVTGVDINRLPVRGPYLLSVMPRDHAPDLTAPCGGDSSCLGVSRGDAPNLILSKHINDPPLSIPQRRLNKPHACGRGNLTRLFAARPNETLAVRDIRQSLPIG